PDGPDGRLRRERRGDRDHAGGERGARNLRRGLQFPSAGGKKAQENVMIDTITAFGIVVTLGAYAGSRVIGRRYPSPLTTPVFLSTIVVICVLVPARVHVTDYEHAKQIMIFLLGPATVGLAVPLYQNRAALVSNLLPAIVGLPSGSLAPCGSALGLAALFGLPDVMRVSTSVKSVTAPVAIALAPIIHGSPTRTATFAAATGMIGAALGPSLMTLIGIHE